MNVHVPLVFRFREYGIMREQYVQNSTLYTVVKLNVYYLFIFVYLKEVPNTGPHEIWVVTLEALTVTRFIENLNFILSMAI